MTTPQQIGRALGWFSVALGLFEILGGRSLAKLFGTTNSTALLRGYGFRELLVGVGILLSPKPAPGWLWARVAGDAMDLASLEAARETEGTDHTNLALAILVVAGVTALDAWCATELQREA